MTLELIATVVAGILGSSVLTQLFASYFAKKKTEAEANKVDADAASTLVDSMLKWQETLTQRINALETAVLDKDKIILELRRRITDLESEVARWERKT
jgi:hypothetical protein